MSSRSSSETALPGSGNGLPGNGIPGNKAANAFKNRIVSLQLRSRILTRSNAVVMPKSPENPGFDLGSTFSKATPVPPPPTPSSLSRTPTPSLRAITSVSMSSTNSTTDYLGVMGSSHNRRRHSDSYFPLKKHNRRHRMRRCLQPKYSYSPNPRCVLRKKAKVLLTKVKRDAAQL